MKRTQKLIQTIDLLKHSCYLLPLKCLSEFLTLTLYITQKNGPSNPTDLIFTYISRDQKFNILKI